jgi:hypothetical protein
MTIKLKAGDKFGRLTVVESAGSSSGKQRLWICKCSCGNTVTVTATALNGKSRPTKSCGCLRIEICQAARRGLKGASGQSKLYKAYTAGAKKRNLKWDLSKSDFRRLTQLYCHYCGAAPSQVSRRSGTHGDYVYNGLDRVDNKLGYLLSNVVACCGDCNLAKRARELGDYLTWLKRSYDHLSLSGQLNP